MSPSPKLSSRPACSRVARSRLAGVWLDGAFQLGANVCLVGLYNAAVLTAERSLCFLVSTQFGQQIENYATSQTEGQGRAGRMLRSLLSTSQTGVAPLYILTNALCAAILVWMPYTLLVEFSMLLSVPSILLFMWSFVALRIQRPYVERPFLIPGGCALSPPCLFEAPVLCHGCAWSPTLAWLWPIHMTRPFPVADRTLPMHATVCPLQSLLRLFPWQSQYPMLPSSPPSRTSMLRTSRRSSGRVARMAVCHRSSR